MDNNSKIILPLLITKATTIIPSSKETKMDVARDFTVNAVKQALKGNDALILVVSQRNANIEMPTQKDLYSVGTLCRIVASTDSKNFLRIRVTGFARVEIKTIAYDANNYYVAEGEIIEAIETNHERDLATLKSIIAYVEKNPDTLRGIPRSVIDDLTTKGLSASDFADLFASYLTLSKEDQQTYLETRDISERLGFISFRLDSKKIEAEVDAQINKNIAESTEKAQRDYILHERLKAVKKELGNDEDGAQDTDKIREKLEKNPYPEHVKAKVKAELRKYEMMPPASLESSLIMSYIQILMDVPWYQHTEDNDDLDNVRRILDEDHFGLTKVKERIVEYLAVKKMTGNLKAPILCFYGPPGCGKTSLGASIARALGRKFFKASLGGISDEAEIRGHRRTYVGSMPGRIIAGMRRAGVNNPVFLLDEVDKLASSYKGDPASALLEVLDPSQNTQFNDNYLEEPYDLSNVLFICTANYLENVPAPLRDRLELIEVNSYTEFEKIEIAKNFLVKKELANAGSPL